MLIIYLIPKLHQNPVGSWFIITSKNCSTKPLSKAVSIACNYSQIENFHRKSKFYFNYNKFWVPQNVDPVIKNINILNRKKSTKSIATDYFSTLYITIPHDQWNKRFCNVTDFVFEGGNRTRIFISKNNVAYWGKKSKGNVAFSKSKWKTSLRHLIQNYYFMVGNSLLRQKIGIPIAFDPAPFGQITFYTLMKTNTYLNLFQMIK